MTIINSLKQFFSISELNSHRVVKSSFVSSKVLLGLRCIFSSYYLIVLIFHLLFCPKLPLGYVLFLTYFSLYGLIGYLWISAYFSLRYYLNPSYIPWKHQHWRWHFLYVILYELNVTLNFLVTIVYCTLLTNYDLNGISPVLIFLNVSYHILNFVSMILEIIFSANQFFFRHFIIISFIILLYIPYAYLIHAIYDIWIYSFLDYELDPLRTILTLLGCVLTATIYYIVMFYLHKFRNRFFPTKQEISLPKSQFNEKNLVNHSFLDPIVPQSPFEVSIPNDNLLTDGSDLQITYRLNEK